MFISNRRTLDWVRRLFYLIKIGHITEDFSKMMCPTFYLIL